MLAKGQITPRLVQAAFILLGDEDDEVRFPLIDLIGDLAFDETGFCRATSTLPKTKEPIIKLLLPFSLLVSMMERKKSFPWTQLKKLFLIMLKDRKRIERISNGDIRNWIFE